MNRGSIPFTVSRHRLPFTTTVLEVPEETGRLSFHLDVKPLLHGGVTLGYRIHIDGKIIAYCPDTGYCNNAVTLGEHSLLRRIKRRLIFQSRLLHSRAIHPNCNKNV